MKNQAVFLREVVIVMNYEESIAYIHQTPKFARELGNAMLKRLLTHLGNPQDSLRFIHIAGTNGKGSVALMLSEILRRSGLRTGLFISPYIERFNERMQVDGTEIPDEELAKIITVLRQCIEQHDAPVSEFALDTAAALCWFEKCRCDIVILETGLGGRLDATNVISKNLVTVFTAIGMDHMQYLGDTIEKITMEKCGIIKEGCPVVSAPMQEKAAAKVIQKQAADKSAELFLADCPQMSAEGVWYDGKSYRLGMQGTFQAYNAATVLETIKVLKKQGISISRAAVEQGMAAAKNMARFEWFQNSIILDGGHNLPAAKALKVALTALKRPVYLCIAMMGDKDIEGFIAALSPIVCGAVTTQIAMPRCCTAQRLAEIFAKHGVFAVTEVDPNRAVVKALAMAREEEDALVCVCGSLYFAGQVRPFLQTALSEE